MPSCVYFFFCYIYSFTVLEQVLNFDAFSVALRKMIEALSELHSNLLQIGSLTRNLRHSCCQQGSLKV